VKEKGGKVKYEREFVLTSYGDQGEVKKRKREGPKIKRKPNDMGGVGVWKAEHM